MSYVYYFAISTTRTNCYYLRRNKTHTHTQNCVIDPSSTPYEIEMRTTTKQINEICVKCYVQMMRKLDTCVCSVCWKGLFIEKLLGGLHMWKIYCAHAYCIRTMQINRQQQQQ